MHPIAFYIGSLSIHWYGILIAIGFLLGFWTASRRALLYDNLPGEMVADLIPWIVVSALVGSRLLFIWQYPEDFQEATFWDYVNIRRGGLVFHGGLMAAAATVLIYVRVRKLPLWRLADALAPSIALGHVFGRLGCFMNGCCYGVACSLPWAVHFPEGHPTAGVGVHPTELYEAAMNLALYGALAWQYRRRRFPGQTFAIYLISYGVLRGAVEFLRGDYLVHYFGWMTVGQVVSVGVLVAGAVLWGMLPRVASVKADGEVSSAAEPPGKAGRSRKSKERSS
ncbi:MAG: prolipoprotein diacylglyceryl transferase [Verrucomicrobiales bacterium]|nr:prolipoprotein diacylglyceryl transferase [Verrucomicrobiales bacterium]